MDLFLEAIGKPLIVLVLVFVIYWSTEWIKRVLKDKLKEVWIQPIALVVGTIIAAFAMFNYDYRVLDLGESKFVFVDFVLQGGMLAAIAGTVYDKYLKIAAK